MARGWGTVRLNRNGGTAWLGGYCAARGVLCG